MSILLNGDKNGALVGELSARLFDLCPALNLLLRDTRNRNLITPARDRALDLKTLVSPEGLIQDLATVVNFEYFTSRDDFNKTIYDYLDFVASMLPFLRMNGGIWVNIVPDPGDRITDSAMDAAMSEIVKKQSDEELKRYHSGNYVSFINVRIINGHEAGFTAEQTCLLADYLSKYRDILVNMPGKELRLF